MGDDALLVMFAILFPVLLVGEVVLAVFLWRSREPSLPGVARPGDSPAAVDRATNDVGLVSSWLIASALTMGIAFVAAFVAVHVLLFSFGSEVAMLGLLASVALLVAIPVVLAVVLRRRAHRR